MRCDSKYNIIVLPWRFGAPLAIHQSGRNPRIVRVGEKNSRWRERNKTEVVLMLLACIISQHERLVNWPPPFAAASRHLGPRIRPDKNYVPLRNELSHQPASSSRRSCACTHDEWRLCISDEHVRMRYTKRQKRVRNEYHVGRYYDVTLQWLRPKNLNRQEFARVRFPFNDLFYANRIWYRTRINKK